MQDLDIQRKVLVGAILDATGILHTGTLTQLIRAIPSKIWDWNIFDEAVQRGELLFDGVSIWDPSRAVYDSKKLTDVIEAHNGDYLRLAGLPMFFREPIIRLLPVETAMETFMSLNGYSLEDSIELICAYAMDVAYRETGGGGDAVVENRKWYHINELFGVNILPDPYIQLIQAQLVAPTRNVERRKLEENVKRAEVNLTEAKTALDNFKG